MHRSQLVIRQNLLKGSAPTVGNQNIPRVPKSFYHQNSGKQIKEIANKIKDTVLVIEATKGPFAKAACGAAQATAAATLAYIAGSSIFALSKSTKSGEAITSVNNIANEGERDNSTSHRIGLTYFHMANSVLASSLSALVSFRLFRNKSFVIRRIGERPLMAIGIGVITPLTMATIVRRMPHKQVKEGTLIPFGMKEVGNLLYAGSIGLLAAPLYLLGGQAIQRAIFVTAGTCTGLQAASNRAPKGALINWGRPISWAVNAVLLSFILTMVVRRDHAAFNHLFRFMMYGGIAIYSTHYCYVAQALKEAAKSPSYDPVNAAMALTMDLLSLYGRFAFLLPPYFHLSRQHHFVVQRGHPSSSINKNQSTDNKEPSFKPGNDDI